MFLYRFSIVVVLSNGRINLFPFTFFSWNEVSQSFFILFYKRHVFMVQITWPCSRTLVTFIGILLLAFAINSFCHTHHITTEPPVLYRSIGCVLALQPASAAGCFSLVSLWADSFPCRLVIWLEHYSKLWGKLLPPPEETYQEFPFFLSGGKFEIQSMIWLLFGGNFSMFPND